MTRRRRAWLIVALLISPFLIYLILLIPEPGYHPPLSSDRQAFTWNRDAYWSYLEEQFRNARAAESLALADSIRARSSRLDALLDSLQGTSLDADAPILDRLETAVFELTPWLAARPDHPDHFISQQVQLREIIKNQSRFWDLGSVTSRDRLYRLLYGSRIALEEVMLQAVPASVPALVPASGEPSRTPQGELLGITVHSGDIVVSRGGAPTSALIARGSDYPGNFSHVTLVHIDSASGQISIVEAHIERGVAIATPDEYLRDTKLRVMALRLRADHPALAADPMLPHRAATIALERAYSEHIPYDFAMDFSDDSRLFCSEVASSPYAELGISLWMGTSHISSAGVKAWLADFGVRHFETQEPSDLEYDPQLTVVAEWRDPDLLWQDHLDNAVVDVMLEGAVRGETLQYDWPTLPFARLSKAYSVVLNWFGGIGPVPEGMTATAALKNVWFTHRHAAIRSVLENLAADFENQNGYRPPYWELVRLARQAVTETRD